MEVSDLGRRITSKWWLCDSGAPHHSTPPEVEGGAEARKRAMLCQGPLSPIYNSQ